IDHPDPAAVCTGSQLPLAGNLLQGEFLDLDIWQPRVESLPLPGTGSLRPLPDPGIIPHKERGVCYRVNGLDRDRVTREVWKATGLRPISRNILPVVPNVIRLRR